MNVYKMTNKFNGMSYVGATIRPVPKRIADHVSAARRGKTALISKAIREFGIAAFVVQVLQTVDSGSYDDLMTAEIQAIREHGTLEPSGYNRTSGGLGTPDCRALESTKLKIGATSKGRVQSEETRRKRSLAQKGKRQGPRPHMQGKPTWNRGIPATEEHRKKLSESRMGGKNWKSKRIEFQGVKYNSIMDAVRATGFSRMQICYRLSKGDAASYIQDKENKGKQTQ